MDTNQLVKSPKISGRYRGYVGDFCCVPGCTNSRGKCSREGKKVSFYQIPKETKRRQLWLDRIRRGVVNKEGKVEGFEPKPHTRICSEHFVGGAKVDDASHPAYVPTIFARNTSKCRQTKTASSAGTFTPSPQTSTKKSRDQSSQSMMGRPKAPKKLDYFTVDSSNAVWNSDHDYVKPSTPSLLPETVESLREENINMKSKQLRLDNIKDNAEKFQFWTNLPNYQVFEALCTYLKTRTVGGNLCYWRGKSTSKGAPTNKRGPERKLSFEEELFIVLVKLKTGNFNEDLAHTFDISPAHVSSIFTTYVNFLHMELKVLFEMQSSEAEQAECFGSFENLRIILDCTELMVHRSSNLDARKKTFSNYKHYDSAKFLVGISPNLTVNYVSKAWGGRASDKHITLSSSALMENLTEGDSVMADRGFNVAGDFKKKGVSLLIPDFKGRDRAQITEKEASRSEYISKARIHVERVIQRIKTFYFLERTVRLNMHDIIEQIFTVCAYLTNFQMPVIRK